MRAPSWDPGFANSRMHGAAAQLDELLRVVDFCAQRRVAVDVGAHIGTWTCELAKRFDEVWAFEPEAENFACLKANVSGHPRCVLEPVALGATESTGRLALHDGGNSGCWRIAQGFDIQVVPLDLYGLEAVDLLKIDAEGYEGKVLQGAEKTLTRSSPVVVFEDNGLGEKLYGSAWVDPKAVLTTYGYSYRTRIFKDEVWTR